MDIENIRAPERLSLPDLRPKKVVVNLGDGEIEVGPLSTADIADLLERHEPLRKIIMQVAVSVDEIIKTAPDAVKSIIASGCGFRGNPEVEEITASLSIEWQSEIMEGILSATFTRGFGPFISRISALGVEVSGIGKAPDIRSPRTPPRSFSPASQKDGSSASVPDNSPPTHSSTTETASAA